MRALLIFLVSIVFAATVSPAVAGQVREPVQTLRFELGAFPAPPLVAPGPSPEVLGKDVEEATAIMKSRQQAEEASREAVRGLDRRPDLQHDVVQGIQAIGIRNALPRR
jgi:hypothetical protein